MQYGIRVLFAEENRVCKESKLHLVESIRCLNVTGILWILWHAKVIVKFEAHLPSGLQLLMIKAIYLGMRVDHIIDALKVECVE